MEKHELEYLIEQADAAWNREDLQAIMDSYAEDATLVIQPGLFARGKDQIRKAVEQIFRYFDHTLNVQQSDFTIIEGGDTALVLAKSTISAKQNTDNPIHQERKATYVYKRNSDGIWRCTVDNSYGVELLN